MLTTDPEPTALRSRKPLTPRQVAFAAMAGNAIELYDFILYSFIAATVFGPLFFPSFEPWLGTLAALSGHAVAFLVRPLGAVVFGRVGDRLGRRPALLLSLAMMGVATLGIGLLPTYTAIGVAAPVVLVVLRLLQGLAVGGEYPGAVVVAVEHAPPRFATLYGAFPQMGNMIGILLAGISLLLANLVSGEAWQSWGWRLPFLFSAVLVLFGLFLRTRLAETPEFVEASARVDGQRRVPGGIGTLLREAPMPLVICVLMWLGPVTYGYAFLTSLLAYVKNYRAELSPVHVQVGLVLTAAALVLLVMVSGLNGDRWGRERLVIGSGVLMVAWAVPSYLLVDAATPGTLWTAMLVGAVSYGIFGGVAPSIMSRMFPVDVRYIGVAIAIAASALVGGALLPLGALAMVGASGGSSVPMMVMMGLSGLATTVGGLMLRSRTGQRAK